MTWLYATLAAYFLFAAVSLFDRRLLTQIRDSLTYTFYVGLLGAAALLAAPFTGFFIPQKETLFYCFLAALAYFIFLFLMYKGLEKIEASRIIPAMGAFLPIFTFVFVGFKELPSYQTFSSFLLLLLGSFLVTLERSKKISLQNFFWPAAIAFFASLSFFLSKEVYLTLPFWTGFIWIRIFVFFMALLLLFSAKVRAEVFGRKKSFSGAKSLLFCANQSFGAAAFVLQSWGVALAGFSMLPVINALQGAQYAVLFILAAVLSARFPSFFKENIKGEIALQKIFAIMVISLGLLFLFLK